MPSMLIECRDCRRHVRGGEARCPFCGATIDDETRALATHKRRPVLRNVPRAVALGLTVGVVAISGAGGCDDEGGGGGGSDDDDVTQQPPYGAPAVGSGAAGGMPSAGGAGGGGGAEGGAGGSDGGTAGAGGDGGTGGG